MNKTENKRRKPFVIILFFLYSAIMLYLLFRSKRNGYDYSKTYFDLLRENINLVPFKTIRSYSDVLLNEYNSYTSTAIINLFGNIGVFIPFGMFLPCLFKRCRLLIGTLFYGGLTVCVVELLQLITLRGCCDIDDLILNLIGIFIGYLVYRLIHLSSEE